MGQQQDIDYRAELDKLEPEARTKYVGGWRTYLQGLPKSAFSAQITSITRRFGPEFASELVQPETMDVRQPAPPVTNVPAADIKAEVPWYQKPVVWAAEQEALQPAFKGLEKYYKGYITPASLLAAQSYSPNIREQLAGRNPFSIPQEQRETMWDEASIPWLAKTATELVVDPLSYFGWGLSTKAMKAASRMGMPAVAKALKPISNAEEAYIRMAAKPIQGGAKALRKAPAVIPDIAELRATGKLVFKKPIDESARSIINNLPTHTYDLLHNLGLAGEISGKPLSQILENLRMGIPDEELFKTIISPQQKRALGYLQKNAGQLDLDTIIKIADKHPDTAASVIGWKQVGLVAKELKLPPPRLATGVLGSFQKITNNMYSLWKRTVLQTPYYVLQNTVENPVRELLVGVRPLLDITDYAKLGSFGEHPMDIQRRVISLADRWNKNMPEHLATPFAKTPATGGVTEAVTGAVAVGKAFPASTVAAYMDDAAIVNTYFSYYDRYMRTLMETTSPETAASLAKLTGLYDDAIKAGTPKASWTNTEIHKSVTPKIQEKLDEIAAKLPDSLKLDPVKRIMVKDFIPYKAGGTSAKWIDSEGWMQLHPQASMDDIVHELVHANYPAWDEKLVEKTGRELAKIIKDSPDIIEPEILTHLKQTSISGSSDDVIKAFQEVQRNKTMVISRPTSQIEKSLPGAIQNKIRAELPRLWAKNDIQGIHRLFEELQRTLPQRIETYQKQVMVQRLKSYRDLIRTSVPRKYQSFVTKVLNSFKMDKISESEARIASAKSLTEFQQAMFKASQASRRELEALAEATMITEAIARNVDDKVLQAWYFTGEQINQRAFKAGEELVDHVFTTANVIRFAKDPSAIRKGWDTFIQTIQSEFPEIAESLRSVTAPDTDSLWSAYRSMQERRWFNVGQEKLRAMGIDFNQFPRVIGVDGKLLTQEDFLKSQLSGLKSWESRIVKTWDKRHIKPTAKNKLLDGLREETLLTKESVALQERQIQNEAREMALGVTYSTFGNYAQRTNLDEFMQGVGVPFWFFPSRSIPFYTSQMIQRPRLGVEIMNMQNESATSEQPSRLFGSLNIPGTNYWYNPIGSTMLWQLADQRNFTPAAMGGLEQGQNWIRNTLGVSLGPQWTIATALVERVMGRQQGKTILTMEPQPIIPQQRWLDAVANLHLPVISPIVGLMNEPFDAYLRAVYGDTVANWQKREVEKTIVDMGFNPQDAPDKVIEAAWDKYYIRQLLSIPGGAVKEMTDTEMARFEAINQKSKDLGLTKQQRVSLRQMGESPFVGLRQDQIEAIYEDVPAQKLWRYIRPWGLTSKSKPVWDDYIQLKLGRETLLYGADKDNPTKGSRLYKEQQFDKALQSGKISPREWKSMYRQSYSDYISKVEQLEIDFPEAPKTEADWESYRELLGWDEPVRHPDDIKLDEYYKVMDSSKFETELGQFDFNAWKKAESTFFQGLSPDTALYINSRKDRYKTPLRSAYSRDMKKVQPYYDLQDAILAQYPPEIANLIKYALTTPDPAIQRAVLMSNPISLIVLRRIRLAKQRLRIQTPEIDRILRFWSS